MSKLTIKKNVMQPGRGIFSNVYFNGTLVAEKHDGQVMTPILQRAVFERMKKEGVPVSNDVAAIDWDCAARLLK